MMYVRAYDIVWEDGNEVDDFWEWKQPRKDLPKELLVWVKSPVNNTEEEIATRLSERTGYYPHCFKWVVFTICSTDEFISWANKMEKMKKRKKK